MINFYIYFCIRNVSHFLYQMELCCHWMTSGQASLSTTVNPWTAGQHLHSRWDPLISIYLNIGQWWDQIVGNEADKETNIQCNVGGSDRKDTHTLLLANVSKFFLLSIHVHIQLVEISVILWMTHTARSKKEWREKFM